MTRVLRTLMGSFLSFVVACTAGLHIARWYELSNYPGEFDHAHFDVAGVWLLSWMAIWAAGTIVSGSLLFRKPGSKAPDKNDVPS